MRNHGYPRELPPAGYPARHAAAIEKSVSGYALIQMTDDWSVHSLNSRIHRGVQPSEKATGAMLSPANCVRQRRRLKQGIADGSRTPLAVTAGGRRQIALRFVPPLMMGGG